MYYHGYPFKFMNIFFSKTQILLLACLFLFSCRWDSSEKAGGIATIDVVNNLGKFQVVPLSELVFELEYIPLETNTNSLIGEVRSVIVTSSRIFIQGYVSEGVPGQLIAGTTRCYAFSRNGQFICEIGSVGQGPGEYQNIDGLTVDEKNQLLYIETHKTLLEYSYEGVFLRSINKPQGMNEQPIGKISVLHDNLFIGHVTNHRGNEIYKFILFNKTGQVVDFFDNHVKFERSGRGIMSIDNAMSPFRLSERIYVKEKSNDTLYYLNEQNELISQFVFNLGKYTVGKKMREIEVGPQTKNILNNVLEVPNDLFPMIGTPDYIFFSFLVSSANIPRPKGIKEDALFIQLGIHDITHKKTQLLDIDMVFHMFGLVNDIDGGLFFWPKYYSSSNELVDIYQAYKMKEMLTEKYFSAHEIKSPQAHQKLKELLKNLDYEDNPVVVIAKLKK